MAQPLLAIGTLKWAAYLALIFAAFTLPGASATCWLVPFLFEGFAEQRERFQPDGLHPTAAAQPLMLETVWKRLRPLLP